MKKHTHGASLYYASDKNIFDALNQRKVDNTTVADLFHKRNTIVCNRSPREELAEYFSRLTHDYYDHQAIAEKLGVIARRERTTSVDVSKITGADSLSIAAEELKVDLENTGDVVHIRRFKRNITINVKYTTINYKRSEFSQVQIRDGTIDFVQARSGYTVRNTQNDYINSVRDSLIGKIGKIEGVELETTAVSLFDVPTSKLRTRFFIDLISDISGFKQDDVSNVYVYKSRPDSDNEEDEEDESDTIDSETHIERVLLRGQGVTRSELLQELLEVEDYYITKISWTMDEIKGTKHRYEIEAAFSNPKDCTGFSFLLKNIYRYDRGNILSTRQTPSTLDISKISKVIEVESRKIALNLRNLYAAEEGN